MTATTYELMEFQLQENTSETGTLLGSLNSDEAIGTGTANAFAMRLQIWNDNNRTSSRTWDWEYKLNSGSWTPLTSISSVAVAYAVGGLTDGGDTTNRLTSRGGDFLTDNNSVCEDGVGTSYTHSKGDYTEVLLSFYIVDADVSDTDKVYFRPVDGVTLTETNLPVITVSKVSVVTFAGTAALVTTTLRRNSGISHNNSKHSRSRAG